MASNLKTWHDAYGCRWSLIAGRLPGRTDNEIKNYWNSTLSKRIAMQRTAAATSMPAEATTSSADAAGAAARRRRSPEPRTIAVSPIRTKALRCNNNNNNNRVVAAAGACSHGGRPPESGAPGEAAADNVATPQAGQHQLQELAGGEDDDDLPVPAVCIDLDLDDIELGGLDGFLISPWRGGGHDEDNAAAAGAVPNLPMPIGYELGGGGGGEAGAVDLEALLGQLEAGEDGDGDHQQQQQEVPSSLGDEDDDDYLELAPWLL
uniref:Uncharacterized protein n=1 Tax=Oryza meridionalis TaxID=40149 RepID=A0A0E0D213_9ORYZ